MTKEVQECVNVSKIIYDADFNVEPVIGRHYFLYKREDNSHFLSLVEPQYWARVNPGTFMAEVELLPDQTWKVCENEQGEIKNE